MKNKLLGIFLLMLISLSVISVIADIEVPEEETETEEETPEETEEECEPQEEIVCEEEQEDCEPQEEVVCEKPEVVVEETAPVAKRKHSEGGFYIANGKILFNMQSHQEGRGFGILVGRLQENKLVNLYFPSMVMQIKELTTSSAIDRLNGFHMKTLSKTPQSLARYEFLSNMGSNAEFTITFRVASGNNVKILLNGQDLNAVKLPAKSKIQDLYQVKFTGQGLLEIVKA